MKRILSLLLLLCLALPGAAINITVNDLMDNSNMELQFYNVTGAQEASIISNGSYHTFGAGSFVVMVLPGPETYSENPLQIIDLMLTIIAGSFIIIVVIGAAASVVYLVRRAVRR